MQFVSEDIVFLQPIFKKNGKPRNKSKVFIKGQDTNCILDGNCLDVCLEVFSYYLLIVSFHKRYDKKDGLFIYLLNKEGKLLDEAIAKVRFFEPLILPVDTDEYEGDLDSYWGYLGNINFFLPNKIEFKFANHFWEIVILEKPLYSWSFFIFDSADECKEEILLIRHNWQYKTYFKFKMT